MKNKKLIFLAEMPITNGVIQSQLFPILKESSQSGYQVFLIETRGRFEREAKNRKNAEQELEKNHISLYSIFVKQKTLLPSFVYFSFKSLKKVQVIIKSLDPSNVLIYTRNYKFLFSVLFIKLMKKIAFIYSPRAPYVAERKHYKNLRDVAFSPFIKHLEKKAIKESFSTIVETKYFKRHLLKIHMLKKSNLIKVIPNSFDTSKIIPQQSRQRMRQKLHFIGKKVIVYAGTLEIWYNFEKMFELFSLLKKKDARLFFQLFLKEDYARRESQKMKAELKKIPKELNLTQGRDYAISHFSPEQRYDYLSACDIGICLTARAKFRNITMPLKILDYWRSYLPLIVNQDMIEARRITLNNKLGVVVNYDNWEGSIEDINLESLYSKSGTDFQKIIKKYSSSAITPQYIKLFNSYFNERTIS